jgi:hypothetical protein
LTWRYPQAGMLVTEGEGACTDEYLEPGTNDEIHRNNIPAPRRGITVSARKDKIVVTRLAPGSTMPRTLYVVSSTGRTVQVLHIEHNDIPNIEVVVNPHLADGIYLIMYEEDDGHQQGVFCNFRQVY